MSNIFEEENINSDILNKLGASECEHNNYSFNIHQIYKNIKIETNNKFIVQLKATNNKNYFKFDFQNLLLSYNFFYYSQSGELQEIEKIHSIIDLKNEAIILLFNIVIKYCYQKQITPDFNTFSIFNDEKDPNDTKFNNCSIKWMLNYFHSVSSHNKHFLGLHIQDVLNSILQSEDLHIEERLYSLNKYENFLKIEIRSFCEPSKPFQYETNNSIKAVIKQNDILLFNNKKKLFYEKDFQLVDYNQFDPCSSEIKHKLEIETKLRKKIIFEKPYYHYINFDFGFVILSNSKYLNSIYINSNLTKEFDISYKLSDTQINDQISFSELSLIQNFIKKYLSQNELSQYNSSANNFGTDNRVILENNFNVRFENKNDFGEFQYLWNGVLIGDFYNGLTIWVYPQQYMFKVQSLIYLDNFF